MNTLRGRHHRFAAVVIAFGALAVGHVPAQAAPTPAPTAAKLPAWTIIYYGVGGNNLEAAMVNDVKEMGIVDFGGEVNLYGFLDREVKDNSTPDGELVDGAVPGLGDWTGGKAFKVKQGKLIEMLDVGRTDSGSPDTLAWFVSQVMTIAPAQHTALILSDHGLGPLAFGTDDEEGSDMSIVEIATALDEALPNNEKLDLIAFDACLMATAEVIYWMSSFADRLVVSEDLIPGFGYDYRDLRGLTADPTMNADELGQLLVDSFSDQYGPYSDYANTSLALIDPLMAGSFSSVLDGLAQAIIQTDSVPQFHRAVADSRAAITLDPLSLTVDLGDLSRRLAQPEFPNSVRIAADSVFRFVDRLVIDQYRGIGRKENTGISIVVPPPEKLAAIVKKYGENGVYSWTTFLNTLAAEAAATPQVAGGAMWTQDTPTLLASKKEGIAIASALDATIAKQQGVSQVRALFGEPTDAGGMYVYGLDTALQDGGTTTFTTAWDYTLWGITNDEQEWFYPTVAISRGASGITAIAVGTVEQPDGQSVPISLRWSIDPSTGSPGNLQLFDAGGGGVAEYSPPAGSRMILDQYVLTPDGLRLDAGVAGVLSLDVEVVVSRFRYQSGTTIAVGLAARDSQGNWYGNFGFVAVPA